jgi:hypothetical protein
MARPPSEERACGEGECKWEQTQLVRAALPSARAARAKFQPDRIRQNPTEPSTTFPAHRDCAKRTQTPSIDA